MASKVNCDVCGKEVDSRGLPGHLRFAHQEETDSQNTGSSRTDESTVYEIPGREDERSAIIFRSELHVTDATAKEELLKTLKNRILAQDEVEV